MTRGLRGRLFWRVYLHGLALLLAVAVALAAVGAALGRGWPAHRHGRALGWAAAQVSAARADPARLQAELDRARDALGIDATVWSRGTMLATNVEPPIPPLPPEDEERVMHGPLRRPHGGPHRSFAAPLAGTPPAYLVAVGGPPGPFSWMRIGATVGAVLVVLALASVPLARAIASPVERLTQAVQAFGSGDLSARARVSAPGEVGALSRSFDEMADRIERLLRAERELLANVSHELRTPLARIRVAIEIAAEGDAERARRTLGEVGRDLEEVERIVDDVLTASRLETGAGGFPLRRERLPAADLVARAAERFRAAHPGRALEVRAPGGLPELDADPVLLRRAVDNILDNAAKYSDATAPIALEAAPVDGALRLAVRDQGIGISPEDVPRLFTPFFRTDRSRARAAGGTGLGLVLAKRIVEAHGGTIAVESAPGRGTTFAIDLPRARA